MDVHFKTAKDGSGSTQKRVRLRTRSPKMNKDVYFWARMSVVLVSSVFARVLEKNVRNFLIAKPRYFC